MSTAFQRVEWVPATPFQAVARLPGPSMFDDVQVDDMTICVLKPDLRASIGFKHHGQYYFAITAWTGGAATKFWKLFHSVPRDEPLFGRRPRYAGDVDALTTEQRVNVIVHACLDLMHLLSLVVGKYRNACTTYAHAVRRHYRNGGIDKWSSYNAFLNVVLSDAMLDAGFLDEERGFEMMCIPLPGAEQ